MKDGWDTIMEDEVYGDEVLDLFSEEDPTIGDEIFGLSMLAVISPDQARRVKKAMDEESLNFEINLLGCIAEWDIFLEGKTLEEVSQKYPEIMEKKFNGLRKQLKKCEEQAQAVRGICWLVGIPAV